MRKPYTAEQREARLAYTREWRKRNKERTKAYQQKMRPRRRRLSKIRRKAHHERFLKQWRASYWRRRTKILAENREYKQRKLAANPHWNREQYRAFKARNPNYIREYYARVKIRNAWLNWSAQCAHSRQSLGESRA